MRKFFIIIIVFAPWFLTAQNLQVHYDLGENRNYITTTIEMFKTDKIGNTFFFVDFDYNLDKEKHPSLAYMEIARCFTLGKTPFSAQIEYNGGLLAVPDINGNMAMAINNAYLAGLDYGWQSADFTKFLNLKVLYKHIAGKNPYSFQLTGVWTLNFFNNKLSLTGFADFWRENNENLFSANGQALAVPTQTKFVFMTEPQFWYNITSNLSLGSEIEIAINSASVQGATICPTIGAKWTF